MSNEQLIKSALAWAMAMILACALVVFFSLSGNTIQGQNSNQNSNKNSNSNRNTNGNANSSQNVNANTSNANSGNTNASTMSGLSSQDQQFVMDAAMGGMMEVELGRWAALKGTSDAVKQFGRRMVDDHSKANTELMSLASKKGITVPTALDEKHRAHITKVSRLSGAEFDRAYIKMMVSDHKKKVSNFEKQSTQGADPDIKAFAGTALPTVQEHLRMAEALSGNQGGNTNSGEAKNSNSNGNSNRP